MRGYIYRIYRDSGFVFIRDEEGRSRFGHVKHFPSQEVFENLKERQKVVFTPVYEDTAKGNKLRAEDITLED